MNRETTPTHTYIPMHTPNTRIHSQRKPEMDDDNDDEDVNVAADAAAIAVVEIVNR